MTILYGINLIAYMFLITYFYVYIIKYFKLGLFNPISFALVPLLAIELARGIVAPAIVLENGLNDEYFQFAIFMANIENFMNILLLILVFYFFKRYHLVDRLIYTYKPYSIKRIRFLHLGIFFLLLFFLFYLLLAESSVGLSKWLNSPRSSYEHARVGVGHYYALALSTLSFSYVMISMYVRSSFTFILISILYIFLVYFLGSKGFILVFGIYMLSILWIKKFKYLRQITIFGGLFLSGLILYNLSQSLNSIDLISIFSYFDFYINSANYYKMYFNNEIELFMGEIYITSFWELVPRSLVEDKPFVYGRLIINEILWPGLTANGNTPAFGGPIAIFADFGLVGVVIMSLLNIALIVKITLMYYTYKYLTINNLQNNILYLYIFIFTMAPAFLKYFAFPINFIIFLLFLFVLSFTMRIKTSSIPSGVL